MKDMKRHDESKHSLTQIECKSCEKVFYRNCELEIHLENDHKVDMFECERCDKKFALKWRLTKHQKMHDSQKIKKCHYFNNQKSCPYEQIGCMFQHLPAGDCRNGELCKIKLCSFNHENTKSDQSSNKNMNEAPQSEEDIELTEEEESFDL